MTKLILLLILFILGMNAFSLADNTSEEPKETNENVLNFDKLWNYGDPGETRVKFMEILPKLEIMEDQSYYLQLKTQIARTYGLQQMFDSAHALLDEVETGITDNFKLVRVRYLLERGRTINSSGNPEQAEPLFIESFELAQKIKADFFAIDAAHMVAIVAKEREERMKWSLMGIEIAEKTTDERAKGWLGSIYNNVGWDYHDAGEYKKALDLFEKALKIILKSGNEYKINIARWSIARAYRSLERIDDALEIQLALENKYSKAETPDGYVWEELGELYLIKNDNKRATEYFAKAYKALSQDQWLAKNEPERLERLKKLGNVNE